MNRACWVRASEFLATGHRKQRALSQLNLTTAYLHHNEPERAFTLARQALAIGRDARSERVVEAARRFRREYSGSPTGPLMRDFDHQLYGAGFQGDGQMAIVGITGHRGPPDDLTTTITTLIQDALAEIDLARLRGVLATGATVHLYHGCNPNIEH